MPCQQGWRGRNQQRLVAGQLHRDARGADQVAIDQLRGFDQRLAMHRIEHDGDEHNQSCCETSDQSGGDRHRAHGVLTHHESIRKAYPAPRSVRITPSPNFFSQIMNVHFDGVALDFATGAVECVFKLRFAQHRAWPRS